MRRTVIKLGSSIVADERGDARLDVLGTVDDAHAPFADDVEQSVRADDPRALVFGGQRRRLHFSRRGYAETLETSSTNARPRRSASDAQGEPVRFKGERGRP